MSTTTNLQLIKPDKDDFYDISVFNTNADIIDEEITELKKSVSDGKTLVANAITGKGVSTSASATFQTMATNINSIKVGIDTSGATASASDILSGKTAGVKGSIITGTMKNNGAVNQTLNAGGSYTIPSGYHNGSGKVTANSLSSQTSGTATSNHILSGDTAWVNGSKVTGTMPNYATGTPNLIQYRDCDNNAKQYKIAVAEGYHGCWWEGGMYEYLPFSTVASDIGLTADKLVSGNTILGINGTAITGRRYASGTTEVTSVVTYTNSGEDFIYRGSSGNIHDNDLSLITLPLNLSFTPRVFIYVYNLGGPQDAYRRCGIIQRIATTYNNGPLYDGVLTGSSMICQFRTNLVQSSSSFTFSNSSAILPVTEERTQTIFNVSWEAWE